MGTPIVAICLPDSIFKDANNCVLRGRRNTQWEVHLSEEDGNVQQMQGCPEPAVLWQTEEGWWGEGPAALGLPGCLPALRPCWGRWPWPGREGRVSSPAVARQTPVGRSGPLPAPGAVPRRGLSVQCQSCRDSGLLGSLRDPRSPGVSADCRAPSARVCGRLFSLRHGETWGSCL